MLHNEEITHQAVLPISKANAQHNRVLLFHPDYPNDSVFGIHMPAFPLYPDGLNQYPFPVNESDDKQHKAVRFPTMNR